MRASIWDLARTSRTQEHHRLSHATRSQKPGRQTSITSWESTTGCLLVASDGACSCKESGQTMRQLFVPREKTPIQLRVARSDTRTECTASRDQSSNEMGILAVVQPRTRHGQQLGRSRVQKFGTGWQIQNDDAFRTYGTELEKRRAKTSYLTLRGR